jgi:hypothetical protein
VTVARGRELLSDHLEDGVRGRVESIRVNVVVDHLNGRAGRIGIEGWGTGERGIGSEGA